MEKSNIWKIVMVVFIPLTLIAQGENWVYRYNGSANYTDIVESITYGADGNLYVVGYSTGSGTDLDFTVISLPSDLGVQEDKVTAAKKHICGSTVFSGSLLLPEGKNCRVFNIAGRVVMPDNIKPGIYFIEIDGKLSKKVIKVR